MSGVSKEKVELRAEKPQRDRSKRGKARCRPLRGWGGETGAQGRPPTNQQGATRFLKAEEPLLWGGVVKFA